MSRRAAAIESEAATRRNAKGRKREALSGPPLDPQLRKQFGKTDLTCQRFAVGMRFFRLRQQVLFFHGSSPSYHFIGAVQKSQLRL